MSRTRSILRGLIAISLGLAAAVAHAEWESRPDFQLRFARGRIEPWFAPEGSGRDWRGELDFIADGWFSSEYNKGALRFVQLGAGIASFEGWHRGTIGLEPEQTSARLTADGDLPFGENHDRRFTLGLLVETRSNEVGGVNVDGGTRYTTTFTYTWETAGRCELRTATAFYDVENVDDKINAGDQSLDRGGRYHGGGAEVSLIFGPVPSDFACERLGPFRELDSYRNLGLHTGARFGTDSTNGSEFVADRILVYGRGWVPLWPRGYDREPRRPVPDVFEWRLEVERAEFSDVAGREDDGVRLQVGVRWGFVKPGKWPAWIKNFDLSAAITGERRTSSVARFEYEELGIVAGLWMRFSRDPGGTAGAQGKTVVRRRPIPGRLPPRVPAEIEPAPG